MLNATGFSLMTPSLARIHATLHLQGGAAGNAMSGIRILIADDHAVVRECLSRMIDDQPDMRLVAEASDGESASNAAVSCKPHVAILDVRMPGRGCVAAIRRMREKSPSTRVLVLSMYDDPHYVSAALAAGAHAYLSKRTSSADLIATIRRLYEGASLANCLSSADFVRSRS